MGLERFGGDKDREGQKGGDVRFWWVKGTKSLNRL